MSKNELDVLSNFDLKGKIDVNDVLSIVMAKGEKQTAEMIRTLQDDYREIEKSVDKLKEERIKVGEQCVRDKNKTAISHIEKACKLLGIKKPTLGGLEGDDKSLNMTLSSADGGKHTAHTSNPVPLVFVDPLRKEVSLREGILADLAPTILELLELPVPEEMTGRSLLAP